MKKSKHTILYQCSLVLFLSISILSCKKDNEETGQDLVQKHGLAGTFTAQITPTFMGTNPMASGEHTILFEDLGDGQLRLQVEKFRAVPMPFEMNVDIKLQVRQGLNNTVLLEGTGGTFQARPPLGEEIDPDDIPSGIELPPGSEGGLSSQQATITGSFGEIEKEGTITPRYELKLVPGVPLPIEILIYSKAKR